MMKNRNRITSHSGSLLAVFFSLFCCLALLSYSSLWSTVSEAGVSSQIKRDPIADEENGIDPIPETAPVVHLGPSGNNGAGLLMVPESTNDRVMLFDAFDGSLVNAAFIEDPTNLSTPINAIAANGEIWVSDQIDDGVFRYDINTGAFLGALVNMGLDNVRGIEFVNDTLFVTNAGAGNGAPGPAIVMFDTNGNNLGFFNAGIASPFDVFSNDGELLVADINNDVIERYDLMGNDLGTFAPVNTFPEQVSRRSNGNILVANFSGTQEGILEFDSNGTLVNFFSNANTDGARGVWELGNGNIMHTNGSGVFILDPAMGTSTPVITGVGARFIEPMTVGPVFDCCVQDDSGNLFIKFNSETGEYVYQDCSKGVTLEGTGTVARDFCKVTLFDTGPDPKRPDRFVSVLTNKPDAVNQVCTFVGSAEIRTTARGRLIRIHDSNTANSACECAQ